MASTYTTSLKIQQIGTGDQSGTWGNTTNTNWALIEQAVAGVQSITMSNANYTMTNLNGISDEARNMILIVGGTNSGIYQVIAPLVPKLYVITNNTSGGYAITIGATTGSTVTIPNGVTAQVYCDGSTGFFSAQTGSAGNFVVNGTLTASGLTDAGNMSVGGTLSVTGAQTNSSSLQATTITSTTQFSGPGTGLTGTAASLTAGSATTSATATSSTKITNSGGWSVTPTGTKLYFNYNGTNVASLDSSGNLITLANVTAYGTP